MPQPQSLFERYIALPRRKWIGPAFALAVLIIPIAVALGQGSLSLVIAWRGLMISPAVMLYILLTVPPLSRMGGRVEESLRAVTTLDGPRFAAVVRHATAVPRRNELAAIGIGVLLGFSSVLNVVASFSWQGLYWSLTSSLCYGLLVWTAYLTLVGTRLTREIVKQPLKVDPLDLAPFEAFGRQSLLLAVVFVGGITFSLVITLFESGVLQRIEFWALYIPLLSLPLTIFFLNMYPIHRVLTDAKEKELKAVRSRLHASFRELSRCLDEHRDPRGITETIQALGLYEMHLREARTWPYNTSILRTLFVSVLIPGGTLLARVILGAGVD